MSIDDAARTTVMPTHNSQGPGPYGYVPPQQGYAQPYTPPLPPAPPRSRTGAIIAAVIAAIAVLGGLGVGGWFLFGPKYLNEAEVVSEIQRVTQENDRIAATDVRCPTDIKAENGATFTCTGTMADKQVTYTVKQTSDTGSLTISYTRPFLDGTAIAKQLSDLTAQQTRVTPVGVQCPDRIPTGKGGTFSCTGTLDGQALTYTVSQTDDQGSLDIAYTRVLPVQVLDDQLAAQLTKDVGEKIVAVCGSDGQTVIVNAPGTPITCGAANAANPSRNAPVTVVIDEAGALTYEVQ